MNSAKGIGNHLLEGKGRGIFFEKMTNSELIFGKKKEEKKSPLFIVIQLGLEPRTTTLKV